MIHIWKKYKSIQNKKFVKNNVAPLSINKPTYLVNVKFQNRFHKIF